MSIQGSLNKAVGSFAGAVMAKKAGDAMDSKKAEQQNLMNKSHEAYGELLTSTKQNTKAYKNLVARQQEAMSYAKEYQEAAEFQRQSIGARIMALRESGRNEEADAVEASSKTHSEELYANYKKRLETLKRGKK